MKDARAEEGGAGNGEDPGENDTTRHTPADGGEAASSADADNGAGDGVRGADRDAEFCGGKERDGAGGLGREAAERIELGDALAHGFDDAPAASHGAAGHRQVATYDDPIGDDFRGLQQAIRYQSRGDNPHAFLSVVGAMAEAIE